ncbi:MAG: lysophospholipid acyltransferase family protein [Romboutsia sp.]
MFNYIKFALYQIVSLSCYLPKLMKMNKLYNKDNHEEIFRFLNMHTRKSLNLVNIKLNILGRDKIPNTPVLFVVNHSSMLDSFILMSSVDRHIGCVIADEPIWRNMPIISDILKAIKCVYINRHNNRDGIKSISEASNNILSGLSMAIFPEGDLTWVKDPNALISDFRNGALKIAYKAKCPIVPLVIKNSKGTYEGFQPIGKIHSTNVEVEFLDAIYNHIENPKLKSKELGETIKNSMIEKMEKL